MVDAVKQKKCHIGADEEHAIRNDCGIRREKPDCAGSEKDQQSNDNPCNPAGEHQSRYRTAVGTPIIFCSDILADKGGGSHCHALHGQHDKLVELIVTAPSGHAVRPEEVDIALDKNIGERRKDGLYRSGHTHSKNLAKDRQIQPKLPPAQTVNISGAGQKDENQHTGEKLGEDRGNCGPGDPGFQDNDKEKVQQDVQDTGKDQEIKRSGGITNCTENPAAHVVDQEAGDSSDIDFQIDGGICKHILRRAHHPEERFNEQYTCYGKNHTQQKGCSHGSFYGTVQLLHITRPKILPDGYTCSDGKPIEEKHHHVGDHCGGTDSSERLFAHKVADDNRVNRVIEHLEYIAQHKGKGKEHQLPKNRADGHIPRCCFFLFLKYHSCTGPFHFSEHPCNMG